MINPGKKEKATLSSLEKKTKPSKNIFFTYEPSDNKYLQKKLFRLRTKTDYSKYEKVNIYINQGYWTKSDHIKFIEALYLYDCSWKKIQKYIKNRTYGQVLSHGQKFYLKLKTFKDEELGLDFTTPNVKSLNDIIIIIQQKESISGNCGKLLYIISEKLSFGKKPGKKAKKVKKLNEEIQLNKNNNINITFNDIITKNNIILMNNPELSIYIRRINERFLFLNSFLFDNLLAKINFILHYYNH